MERTVTAGLAGLIITAGAYASGRRNPRYEDPGRRRHLDVLLGLTAMSFASAIAVEVLA